MPIHPLIGSILGTLYSRMQELNLMPQINRENARGMTRLYDSELASMTYTEWLEYHAVINSSTVEVIQNAWGEMGYLTETGRHSMDEGAVEAAIPYFGDLTVTEDLKANEFFINPDFTIPQEDSMYSITENLTTNSSEIFKSIIPTIKFKSKLGFLAQLTNHEQFNPTMESYIVAQRTAMINHLTNLIETNLSPFMATNQLRVRDNNISNNPSLSGMISVFLRRLDENNGTTDSVKVVAVCKYGFLVRFSNMGNRRFKYYMFYSPAPLDDAQWDYVKEHKIEDVIYFPKIELTNRLHEVYSESGTAFISKDSLMAIFKGSRLTHRDRTSCFEERSRKDVFKFYTGKSHEQIKTQYRVDFGTFAPYIYNLDQLRATKEGEKPQVLISSSGRVLDYKDNRKFINHILSLVLRSFPLIASRSQTHECKIKAPLLGEEGDFDSKKNTLYSAVFYCAGRTMFCDLIHQDYSIQLVFLLNATILDLTLGDMESFKNVIHNDYAALNLEEISNYKVLNTTLNNNIGKIARKMLIDRMVKKDSFYVDETFKSFFDGIKSSLELTLNKPVLIQGKPVDSRVAPSLFASATKEERRLIGLIKSITNKNYYNGGVCVNIKGN